MFCVRELCSVVFFFFQAEDGIRDLTVTGVQTCALPISAAPTLTTAVEGRIDGVPQVGDRRVGALGHLGLLDHQIGRASCRERVEISVVAVSLKKKEEGQ